MRKVIIKGKDDLTAQQALDLAEIERDRYREMRRKVLEEAAQECERLEKKYHRMRAFGQAAEALRDLASRDPLEPQFWRDTLGPEDRYEANKGPANG
jgi:4-alpha-glucanotransferase